MYKSAFKEKQIVVMQHLLVMVYDNSVVVAFFHINFYYFCCYVFTPLVSFINELLISTV